MTLIGSGLLALKLSTGLTSQQERRSLRIKHIKEAAISVANLAASATAAGAIGVFIVPNLFGQWCWPQQLTTQSFMNMAGGVRIGCGLAGFYWGYCKMFPRVWHHISMVWDPEQESVIAFQKKLRVVFDDAMRLLVTLVSLAVPAIIFTKSISWLFF